MTAPVRTAIWGSCISRDTFEYLPDTFELTAYVARQSWISAGSDARTTGAAVGSFDSPFQKRVVSGDVAGNAYERLATAASELDLLLLDLCDERLGVVRMADGTYLTRSVEKISNGAQEVLDADGEVIDFGTDEHLKLWRAAAQQLVAWLSAEGLLGKALLLAPDWAILDETGTPTPTSFGRPAIEANLLYQPYYEAAEELGIPSVRLEGTLASTTHVWGLASFHFHDVTYGELVAGISTFLQRSSTA